MLSADPPLRPSGDEARSWLREELLAPDYHRGNLLQDLLHWLGRLFDDGVHRASDLSPLSTAAAMTALLALALGVALLVGRTRASRRHRRPVGAVLTEEAVTAAELRARAERARAEGRHEAAVVDAFRALALRQQERGRVSAPPGATAHEVAAALAGVFPAHRGGIDRGARLFEDVLYGHLPARADEAADLLGLDDELAAV